MIRNDGNRGQEESSNRGGIDEYSNQLPADKKVEKKEAKETNRLTREKTISMR